MTIEQFEEIVEPKEEKSRLRVNFRELPILNEHEAAAYIDLKVSALRTWRYNKDPRLPYVKYGTKRKSVVRYRRSDLENFISLNTHSIESPKPRTRRRRRVSH